MRELQDFRLWRDSASFPFSPAGRRWPEGSDEGVAEQTGCAAWHPLIPLPRPSPRGGEGGMPHCFAVFRCRVGQVLSPRKTGRGLG